MISNQKVALKLTRSGALQVTSLQDVSTPGVYQRYTLTPNSEYRVELMGAKSTTDKGSVHLWIGDIARETLYWSKDSLKDQELSTIIFHFCNNTRTLLHIGALFDKVVIGDQFQLIKLTVTKIKEGVTNSQGEPPRLNTKAQRNAKTALKKVYDKCWEDVMLQIESSSAIRLEDIWYEILNYEYRNTVRDYIYYGKREILYEESSDFYDAIDYSRKPVLDAINIFNPEAVIEAGAGWGRNLYYLFMKGCSKEIDYYGLEFAEQGLKAMTTMHKYAAEYSLYNKCFDFNCPSFELDKKYNRILLFTMWSIKEMMYLNKMFFYLLLDCAVDVMGVHLEPVGWQIKGDTNAFGHFNRNLYSLLKELEQEGRIRITDVKIDMIGIFSKVNAASLLVWQKL